MQKSKGLDDLMGFASPEEREAALDELASMDPRRIVKAIPARPSGKGLVPSGSSQPLEGVIMTAKAAGQLALRAGTSLVEGVSSVFSSRAASNPQVVDVVAKRIGVPTTGGNVLGKVTKAISENKITAALVAWELGDAAHGLLKNAIADDPDIAALAQRYGIVIDDPADIKGYRDIGTQTEEIAMISRASNIVGGYEKLILLRRVLTEMKDSHFDMYDMVKAVAKGL